MTPGEKAPSEPERLTVSESAWPETTGEVGLHTREPGSHVGDYIVLSKLGAGGMGVVYAAYDPHLDRKIALKVLHGDVDEENLELARARMIREGRSLAKIAHPNVVAIHDVGQDDGEVYIAMELVDGRTLTRWRRDEEPTWKDVVEVFLQIAAGLTEVHDAGLVHRDVKPENVLIDRNGRPRVTDFGLARAYTEGKGPLEVAERAVVANAAPATMELTKTGARLGTPAYMSREVLQFGEATAKSDQFSYCVALWECLYGERPFAGDNWISLIVAVENGAIREPPTVPGGHPVPRWLRRIVARGLASDPDERWPSLRELAVALAAGDPARGRKRMVAVLGIGAVVAMTAVAMVAADAAAEQRARSGCKHEGEAIRAVWGPQQATAIEAAFTATGKPDAADLSAKVTATIDTFADDWSALREETCIAATVDATMEAPLASRTVECLDEARAAVAMTVELFSAADEVMVARSLRTVNAAKNLDLCRDARGLQLRPARPTNPAVREEVNAIHTELRRTVVHEHVGRYEEALTLTRALLQRALATEDLSVVAKARYRVAVFLEKLGKYEEAVDVWVGSFHDAVLAGDEPLASDAAASLAFCEGYQLSRHDAGLRWAELAGVYLERLGQTETLDEARRLDMLAVMLEMKGDYDASIRTHRRSLALRRELGGPDHQSVGYGLANLAGVLQKVDRWEEARESLREAKRIFEGAFGPDNPTTAHVLNNLGNLLRKHGESEEAEALLQRVKAIWIESIGADHPDVGDVLNSLAEIRRASEDHAGAIELHQQALAIHRAGLPKNHPQIGHTAIKLAQVLELAGRPDDARTEYQLALRILEKADASHRDGIGRAAYGLGTLDLAAGQRASARDHFERAIAEFEAHHDDNESWIARAREGLEAASG